MTDAVSGFNALPDPVDVVDQFVDHDDGRLVYDEPAEFLRSGVGQALISITEIMVCLRPPSLNRMYPDRLFALCPWSSKGMPVVGPEFSPLKAMPLAPVAVIPAVSFQYFQVRVHCGG